LQGSWSDHYNLNSKKKEKKALLQRNVKVGGHPMESVSHGLRKEKRWVGVPKLYKIAPMCQISKNSEPLSLFIMDDSKSPLLVVDIEQPHLKRNFYLCFTNEKL
jgi:hypothetical protein